MLVAVGAQIPNILCSSRHFQCLAALGSGIFRLNVGKIAMTMTLRPMRGRRKMIMSDPLESDV